MASFDEVQTRRMHDEEESFLDWEGEATLFSEEDEEEDDEIEDALEEEGEGVEPEDDDDIEELDFG